MQNEPPPEETLPAATKAERNRRKTENAKQKKSDAKLKDDEENGMLDGMKQLSVAAEGELQAGKVEKVVEFQIKAPVSPAVAANELIGGK